MQHLKLLYSFSETFKQSIINVWTDIIKGKQPLFSYWLGIKLVSLGFFPHSWRFQSDFLLTSTMVILTTQQKCSSHEVREFWYLYWTFNVKYKTEKKRQIA